MYRSVRTSHIILTFGLAAVFLWFGIDKFIDPNYWITAWVPQWILKFLSIVKVQPTEFIFLNGAFEILIGISLISGILSRFFAFLGALFILAVIVSVGLNEVTVRDIGLLGGLLAIASWPTKL